MGRLVGCAGMERHGRLGLLRSAAVVPEFQRSGLGTKLTEAILQDAAQQGLSEMLLLTTTARDFFEKKFGFEVAGREDYDERLAQSPEWRLPRCFLGGFDEGRYSACGALEQEMSLIRRSVAEAVGTGLLLATVIGSGVMGERLSGGNVAIALLANTLATGAGLVALIITFGPVSGGHFNPAVTLADASQGGLPWKEAPAYITAQLIGAFIGAAVAQLMFSLPLFSASQHSRAGWAQLFSEFIATFGLLAVIWGCSRQRSESVPLAVGAYITAAYWFTSSTSFANPAVTLARAASDTFAGIRPVDAPGFIAAQLTGAVVATALFRWLFPSLLEGVTVVVKHCENS